MISYPALFKQVVNAYVETIYPLSFDRLAAVPYAALPSAAAIALKTNQPLIYPRKEVKVHGTGQAIEGTFEAGHTALVIEDVVTTGGSILTAIKTLEEAGLVVNDVAVLVDREQGGKAALMDKGYHLHAVLTIGEILDVLRDQECISSEMVQTVKAYLRNA